MRLVGILPGMEEMDKLRDAPAQWSIRLLAIESEMTWLEKKLKGDKSVQTANLILMACTLKTGNSSMALIQEHGKLALDSREADGFLKKMQQRLGNYKMAYEDGMAKKNNEASLKTV
ncbi:unnamed protein product [Linum trigynum]|uniref:Uncharacterized protein n=1 Tax=Linum trigynum TaxID=586398 RepID=A0AAV2ELP0_9ROSI